MCAQYEVHGSAKALSKSLKLFTEFPDGKYFHTRILPHAKAPVVVAADGKRLMRAMQFSLVPAWSKEPKVKFATHNARLTSFDEEKKKEVMIYEKATWRSSFGRRHCLVPITDFVEPIYTGQYAGNMVRFFEKNHELLVAAGLWEEWVSKETGEVVDSFTIITHEPLPFVKKVGHDRSPLFLDAEGAEEWLDPTLHPAKDWVKFLMKHQAKLDVAVEKDRALKPGWEKRVKG